jgi:hypothetical protein
MEPKEMPKGISYNPGMRNGKPVVIVQWYNSGFIDRY